MGTMRLLAMNQHQNYQNCPLAAGILSSHSTMPVPKEVGLACLLSPSNKDNKYNYSSKQEPKQLRISSPIIKKIKQWKCHNNQGEEIECMQEFLGSQLDQSRECGP